MRGLYELDNFVVDVVDVDFPVHPDLHFEDWNNTWLIKNSGGPGFTSFKCRDSYVPTGDDFLADNDGSGMVVKNGALVPEVFSDYNK